MADWIGGAIKRPGQLHRDLGVPQGEKIPPAKLAAAKDSDNPKIRQRANLASTLKKFEHGGMVKAGSPTCCPLSAGSKQLSCK